MLDNKKHIFCLINSSPHHKKAVFPLGLLYNILNMSSKIQSILDEIFLPVIEIAGPTPRGYRVMERLNLTLPITKVTNISKGVTVYTEDDVPHNYSIDEVIDVRDITLLSESIGGVLCSYLPSFDYDSILSHREKAELMAKEYRNAITQVSLDPKNYICLHIKLLLEVARILTPGGVFILQGMNKDDVKLAKSLQLIPLLDATTQADTESQIYLKKNK